MNHSYHEWKENDLLLHLKIQPNAKKTSFGERYEDRLKIYLNAPPIDGKANTQLINFLAKQFRTPKSHVIIVRGQNNRNKDILIVEPKSIPTTLIPYSNESR